MRRAALLLVSAAAVLLAACAGAPPAAPPPAPPVAPPAEVPRAPAPAPAAAVPAPPAEPPFTRLAARFTERALKQEKGGELRQAYESWRVVAALRPAAAEPQRRVADLGARLAAEAGRRYAAGIARLKDGAVEAARRELLLALAADPGHGEALDALKNRLEPLTATHTVADGETFAAIARQHYGDAEKAALIARVNDLDPAGRPVPGSTLLIPTLAPVPTKAAAAAKRSPAAEPAEPRDAGYETEPAAIAPEAVAPPAAPPVTPPQPQPDPAEERRRHEKAEDAYTAGVRFFINQQLDEAIRAWERTLALDPEHPKAQKDIEKARALQQKLKDIR